MVQIKTQFKSRGFRWFINRATQQDYTRIFGNTKFENTTLDHYLFTQRRRFYTNKDRYDIKFRFFYCLLPEHQKTLLTYINTHF